MNVLIGRSRSRCGRFEMLPGFPQPPPYLASTVPRRGRLGGPGQ